MVHSTWGGGYLSSLNQISLLELYFILQNHLLDFLITFIFGRYHHSHAVVTPAKYECDI